MSGNRREHGRVTGFWVWTESKITSLKFCDSKGQGCHARERQANNLVADFCQGLERNLSGLAAGSSSSDAKLLFAYLTLQLFDFLPTPGIAYLRKNKLD